MHRFSKSISLEGDVISQPVGRSVHPKAPTHNHHRTGLFTQKRLCFHPKNSYFRMRNKRTCLYLFAHSELRELKTYNG